MIVEKKKVRTHVHIVNSNILEDVFIDKQTQLVFFFLLRRRTAIKLMDYRTRACIIITRERSK